MPDGSWQTVVDRAEVTRLGEGLRRARAAPAGADAAHRRRRRRHGRGGSAAPGAAEIAAVATAGMRIAENSAELVDAVRERCGVGIEVISGEEEARLAYLAATSALDVGRESLVVFDTGGGSSQFTFGRPARVEERFSVDVGAARYTERFGLDGVVSDEGLAQALAGDRGRPRATRRAAATGRARRPGRRPHEPRRRPAPPRRVRPRRRPGNGPRPGPRSTARSTSTGSRTAERRREIVGLQPARAEVILAGACIVRTVLDKLQLRRAHGQRPRPPPRPARRALQCRTSALSRTTSRPIPTFMPTARSRPAEPSRSIRA